MSYISTFLSTFFSTEMPPVRRRDSPLSGSSPAIQRRLARGLSVDISLANNKNDSGSQQPPDELDIALAEKELELFSLLSPLDILQSPLHPRINTMTKSISPSQFPEIINSFESFSAMKTLFLTHLAQKNLLHIIPESKLYRSVYFPYG
jgi:hypothetical protein